MSKPWTFSIDIVGTCNLRCPSCPVGNSSTKNPAGLMSMGMFVEILDKIAERPGIIPKIDLYNWGEPSLHKQLPDFIAEINRRGWYSNISSNLNIPSVDRLLEVPPTKIRLSVSGYDQSKYGVTHAKGEIELVKSNWHRLVHLKTRRSHPTILEVAFHVYKHNKKDMIQWAALASQSGSKFSPVWSLYQPLEDIVNLAVDGLAPPNYSETVSMMEVDPLDQFALGKVASPKDCRLRYKQTAINWDGSVALCCGVYDTKKYAIAESFLDVDWDVLQRRKYEHPFCKKCFDVGGPGLLEVGVSDEIDRLAVSSQEARGDPFVVSIAKGLKVSGRVELDKIFFSRSN